MKFQGKMYSLHGFLFKIFPCAAWDYTGAARNCPDTPLSPRTGPPSLPSPGLPLTRATAPQKTQKGGRISPAAKRFPPSPFREAVKPPLLVPVLRDGLGGDLCDGHPLGLRSGEDRFHDVGREVVQGKDSCDV